MEVGATSQSRGIANVASGSFTSDNTAVTVTLGFVPRYVKVFNATDVITWEKTEGMAAAAAIRQDTTDGNTMTNNTSSNILINDDGTITISATAAGNAKAISWIAIG